MKKYIFIDNFRGFRNTFIPILDVNFLVGQNSTGKTSVLGLLKLLSTPHLLLGGALADDDINFGNFRDMVSAHAQDQTYFRIGLAEEISGTEGRSKSKVSAMLFTYREHRGLPQLARFTSIVRCWLGILSSKASD
jgi:recombinational DNA repair ATPase RecF